MTRIFGKGAYLLNEKHERFMEKYPKKELETRDILSYAMFKENKVLIDFSKVAEEVLKRDSPYLYRLRLKGHQGEWIMSPVQHYCMGGVQTDEWGRTNIPRLYACGEVTGGLHGANRLGGGALTESLVFGRRTGRVAVQENSMGNISDIFDYGINELINNSSTIDEAEAIKKVKEIMWKKVGIERSSQSLQEAADDLNQIALNLENESSIQALQSRDKVRSAWASAFAAASRKESRGHTNFRILRKKRRNGKAKTEFKKQAFNMLLELRKLKCLKDERGRLHEKHYL
ncbi:FAD-binding protein [Cytobacillus oceanisediminis]|nr:FAD-binding protein [Cytobacillus oceanisediminis]